MSNPFDEFQRAAPAPAANPFDEFQRATPPVRGVLSTAQQFKPDAVAEAARLATRYPAPFETAYRQLDTLRAHDLVNDREAMLAQAPALRRYMETNFPGAAMAQDDIGTLAKLERFAGNVGSSVKAGVFRASRGVAGTMQAGLELVAPVLDPLEPLDPLATSPGLLPRIPVPGGNPLRRLAEGFAAVGGTAGEVAKASTPKTDNDVEAGFFSGIQSLTQNLLALPMAFAPGGQGAALASMTSMTGGDAYQTAREKGLGIEQALPFAASQAAIEYATEKLPLGVLLKDVKAGAGFLQVLGRQIALEIPGEQIATVLQDLNEWAVLNPDKPFSTYLEERPSAAVQTLVATVVGAGGSVAVAKGLESVVSRAARDGANLQRAGVLNKALEDAFTTAEQSLLRQRSPEEFRALMGVLAQDGQVWVDAEVLNQLPADVLQQMGATDEVQGALATNTPVAVKVADALSLLSGTPSAELFMQNARVAPDAPSFAEAEQTGKQAGEYLQQQAEAVILQAQDQEAARQSQEAVRVNLAQQITAAGRYSPMVSDQMALWAAAFYTAYGSRLGITAEEMYQRYPLRVLGAPSKPGQAFVTQGKPGEMTVEGYHFSAAARPSLSTAFYGTQYAGSAKEEIKAYPDKRIGKRLSFYFDKGTGIRPESGVGGIAHRAQLTNIYDSDADPLKLKGGSARAFESKVLDAGFSGYATRMDGTQPGQVILLGDQEIAPEVLGPMSRIDNATRVPALQAREPQWQTQSSGDPAMMQAKLARMQSNPAWADYELRVEGRELQARKKEAVFEQRGEQKPGKPVPTAVDAVANVNAAFELANGQQFKTNRDLKLALQERVLEALKAGKINLEDFNAGAEQYLVRVALLDAQIALETNPNAVGWYNEKVTKALRLVALVHPEIQTDPQAKFAFVWAMAVTSNGLKVDKNFELAEVAYSTFKSTGKMPTNIQAGQAQAAINNGLALFNEMLAKHGFEALQSFMTTKATVKEIQAFSGLEVGGENLTTEVYGSAILGPKIGNGFFSNLYGRFEQLTMDRWLMRTWGRWTGTLIEANPEQVRAKRVQLRSLIQGLDKDQKKAFEAIIKRKLTVSDADAVALAIWKASQKPINRARMAEVADATDVAGQARLVAIMGPLKKGQKRVSFGDELRKVGNSLTKYNDGQKEAPSGPPERNRIRKVFGQALAQLQERHPSLTMSDLQALLWYPEKRLYDAAKEAGEGETGYEDDAAPDYANAAAKLAREKGVPESDIARTIEEVDNELRAADRAAGTGRTAGGEVPADQPPAGSVRESSGVRGGPGLLEQQAGGLTDGNRTAGYSSGGLAPLEGAPNVAGAAGPDPRLVAVAEQYAADNGIDLRRQAEYAVVDPERAARIAAAYETMPHAPNDPAVRAAYDDLARQTMAQYQALAAAGYQFYLVDETNDPYAGNPWNAMRDLRANRSMGVFATEAGFGTSEFDPEGNPLLADTGLEWGYGSPDGPKKRVLFNDLFRAVHDAFGHGLEGAGFRAQGEENAWQAHVRLFTGPAVGAITSETRGQNSWLNYGPHGAANQKAKVEDTIFADQKTGLMPEWTWSEGRVPDAQSDALEQAAPILDLSTVNVALDRAERFVLTDRDNPGIILTTDPTPEFDGVLMGADLEVTRPIEEVGGKGSATKLYLRALQLAQNNGMGWQSSMTASDATVRMYERLTRMGVPFTLEGGVYSISPAALSEIDIPALVRPLEQAAATPRGTFSPRSLELVLNPNANLSTFFHETGHFFLEVMADIAAQPGAPAQIVEDMNTFLKWAGVTGGQGNAFRGVRSRWSESARGDIEWWAPNRKDAETYAGETGQVVSARIELQNPLEIPEDQYTGDALNAAYARAGVDGVVVTRNGEPIIIASFNRPPLARTPLETWNAMTLDQKRPYHERWAESVEQYVMEGKAPSVELQPLMRRFATWLKSVYGSIKQFLAARGQATSGPVLGQSVGVDYDASLAKIKQFGDLKLKRYTEDEKVQADSAYADEPSLFLKGVREVPLAELTLPNESFYESPQETARIADLARQIQKNGKITPVLVVEGTQSKTLRLAEGQHRARALRLLGYTSVPALVALPEAYFRRKPGAFGQGPAELSQNPAQPSASGMQLNDDIRRVMDRMLATDEQIAQANEAAGLAPDADADAQAAERLNKRSMADLKWAVRARDQVVAKLRKQAAAIEKDIRQQVEVEVDQRPEMRAKKALDALAVAPEYAITLAEHKAARKAAETATREEVKAALLAENPEAKGLVKGQLLMKNKRDIDNKAEAAMIKWDTANPTPQRPVNRTDQDVATIADSFGFEGVDAMLQAIDAFGSRKDAIDGMTEQRMLEEHGDLVDERAITEAANEAVHNEARARSLATELRTQREMLNTRTDTGQTNAKGSKITVNALVAAAKQFGQSVAERTLLRDLKAKAWAHTAAERRAAGRWQAATSKGETQEAVKAKQDQVLNHAAARALGEAQAEVREIREFFARVAKGNDEAVVEKGRDPDIVNAARAILAEYGMETATTKRAADYLELVKTNDPDTAAAVEPMVSAATANAQPLEALSLAELRDLNEAIDALWHLAKRSRQSEVDGNLVDRQELADDLFARMEEIGIPDKVPGESGAVTKAESRSLMLRQAVSFLRRVEQWAEGFDGRYGGPFLRYIFQPVKAAADRYRADRVAYRKRFQDLLSNVAPIVGDQAIAAPELGYTFGAPGSTRGVAMNEILHAIAHTGNDSNKRKLLLGRRWATENADGTLDTSKWDAFIARLVREGKLERAHFDFVQGIWDLLEDTKPLAQSAHRDAFGRFFSEVTANSFVDPFGVTRRGGYVPAMVDPDLVKDNEIRKLAEQENESMAYAFPQPAKGFTQSRVEGYTRPLMLDLRSLGQHLDKVLLFSHMTVPVRDVRKLITDKKVAQPLTRIDPTVVSGMLQPWLQRSAQQVVETPIVGAGKWARLPSVIRARAGAALMFANVSNAIQQVTGLVGAGVKVGPSYIMRAMAQHVAHPAKMAKAVWAASPYMDDRAKNEVAIMNEQMTEALLNPTVYEKAQNWSMRHAYFLQTGIDNALSPIIWTAGYNQAMAEGMAHEQAVSFADGVVRQTQGSTLPEDVSRFETGPAYARIFTQFVAYFNMMANTNATALQQVAGEVGLKRGAGRAFSIVMLGLMIPLWTAEAIALAFKGGPEDEEQDGYLDDWLASVFGFGTVKGLLAMVPIAGQAVMSAVNRLDSNPVNDRISLSPGLSLIESALGGNVQTVTELLDENKDMNDRRAVRDAATLVSIFTGLPLYAVARPAGYLAGVAEDRIQPTGPADFARGLITGTPSPESKQ